MVNDALGYRPRAIDLQEGKDIELPTGQRIRSKVLSGEERDRKVIILQSQMTQIGDAPVEEIIEGDFVSDEQYIRIVGEMRNERIAPCIEAIRSADTVHEILIIDSNLPKGVSAPRLHLCQSEGKEPVMIVEYADAKVAKTRSEMAASLARDIMKGGNINRLSWLAILKIEAKLGWDAVTRKLGKKMADVPTYKRVIDEQYVSTLVQNISYQYGLSRDIDILTLESFETKTVGMAVRELSVRDIMEQINRINSERRENARNPKRQEAPRRPVAQAPKREEVSRRPSAPAPKRQEEVRRPVAQAPKREEVSRRPSATAPKRPVGQGRPTPPPRR